VRDEDVIVVLAPLCLAIAVVLGRTSNPSTVTPAARECDYQRERVVYRPVHSDNCRPHSLRTIADDEHPAPGEAQNRDGEVGHLDGASNTLSEPRSQFFHLIGWDFNEVLGLAGKDFIVFDDLVNQMGARGRRPAIPGGTPTDPATMATRATNARGPVVPHGRHDSPFLVASARSF
jgi:hypothetical protein